MIIVASIGAVGEEPAAASAVDSTSRWARCHRYARRGRCGNGRGGSRRPPRWPPGDAMSLAATRWCRCVSTCTTSTPPLDRRSIQSPRRRRLPRRLLHSENYSSAGVSITACRRRRRRTNAIHHRRRRHKYRPTRRV